LRRRKKGRAIGLTLHLVAARAAALAAIAAVATDTPLDVLWARRRHVTAVVRQLERAGHRNPTVERERLARARIHRGYLDVGGRVRALDWDNVGTVTAIFDATGTALVTFTSSDGTKHATRTIDWADLKPIDHPDPVELTGEAENCFALAEHALAETTGEWNE
jgi:hypothetical protein